MAESKGNYIIFPGQSNTCPILYLVSFPEEGIEVHRLLWKRAQADFTMVLCTVPDWNRDLSPWPAPALGKGEAFAGGAAPYLRWILEEVCLSVEKGRTPLWRGIAGYSLAGLFSLWALFQTDHFQRAATVSGSLWYPGLLDWVQGAACPNIPQRVYFSLGDKEDRTRHPLFSQNGTNTEALQRHFQELGTETVYLRNPGNHYTDPAGRTVSGLRWLLEDRPNA